MTYLTPSPCAKSLDRGSLRQVLCNQSEKFLDQLSDSFKGSSDIDGVTSEIVLELVSYEHSKSPPRHMWVKQMKFSIKVTFHHSF